MITVELEDLRSGREQVIGCHGALATVRLTEIGRAAARDSGAWTGIATMVETELADEVTHIITRTARRTGRKPPFILDCAALPAILDDTVAVSRIEVGDGGPEVPAEPE